MMSAGYCGSKVKHSTPTSRLSKERRRTELALERNGHAAAAARNVKHLSHSRRVKARTGPLRSVSRPIVSTIHFA